MVALPKGENSPADLELSEANVVGSDDDIAGKRELNRKGVRDALDGHDDGFGNRLAPDPSWIESSSTCDRHRALLSDDGATAARSSPEEQ
jgi:hypothetical protein